MSIKNLCWLLFFSLLVCNSFLQKNGNTNKETAYVMRKSSLDTFINFEDFPKSEEDKKNLRITDNYTFEDTLYVPYGLELFFDGGSLSGPIVFSSNYLSGKVNLKGSTISGRISNKVFHSSWICYADGKGDDAPYINDALSVCDSFYFDEGLYLLQRTYKRSFANLKNAIESHILINRSNVKISSNTNATILSSVPSCMFCIYSAPEQSLESIKNIRIESLTIKTNNDGQNFYEFCHVFRIIGVDGLCLENCYINDFWGDAICLSSYNDTPNTGERSRNTNVVIKNNTIVGGNHFNNRNGISVVSGRNIVIENNEINNTSRFDMPGAIDIEPNNSVYIVKNVKILNNIIKNCQGTAGGICVHINARGGSVFDVLIKGNRISSSTSGIAIVVKNRGRSGNFTISKNLVALDTRPYQFVGEGESNNWIIKDNTFLRPTTSKIGGKINVSNLKVD